LLTKAVSEMPELQGKMGGFYAKKQGYEDKISDAIYEHYLPSGANSALPKTSVGIAISIADKLDSITGLFLAGEKPTSSKDPFALRRLALGIIKICVSYNIDFPLKIITEKSLNLYKVKALKTLLSESKYGNKQAVIDDILKFFIERLKSYLKENESIKQEVLNIVVDDYVLTINNKKYCNITYLTNKAKFLNECLFDERNSALIALYKRCANVLSIEEKNDYRKFDGKISRFLLKTKYEKDLYYRIKQISSPLKKFATKGEFQSAFKLLCVLEAPTKYFFDHIIVNDENKKLRENRLFLLSKIRGLFNEIGILL
jgi:glycyl-tRNA synthetase beta chain